MKANTDKLISNTCDIHADDVKDQGRLEYLKESLSEHRKRVAWKQCTQHIQPDYAWSFLIFKMSSTVCVIYVAKCDKQQTFETYDLQTYEWLEWVPYNDQFKLQKYINCSSLG